MSCAKMWKGGEHMEVSQGVGIVEKLFRGDFMLSFMSSFGILSMEDISKCPYI